MNLRKWLCYEVLAKFGGGGSTNTAVTIPPELQALYRGSANQLLAQQGGNGDPYQRDSEGNPKKDADGNYIMNKDGGGNPISQYNAQNPLAVAGADRLQSAGASAMMGGLGPSGLDGLALQSILRQPGLAGAGPTTGQYDYGSEAGLGDMMSFLNPKQGEAPGISGASVQSGVGYDNKDPNSTQAPSDFSSLQDALGKADAPYGSGGGGYGPAGALPTGNQGSPDYSHGATGHPQLPGDYDAPFAPSSNGPTPSTPAFTPRGGAAGGSGIATVNPLSSKHQQAVDQAQIDRVAAYRARTGETLAMQHDASPFKGEWKYDDTGMVIGPGGVQFTGGEQHEGGGGTANLDAQGRDSSGRQLKVYANPYGVGEGPNQAQWLAEANRINAEASKRVNPTGQGVGNVKESDLHQWDPNRDWSTTAWDGKSAAERPISAAVTAARAQSAKSVEAAKAKAAAVKK